MVFADNVPPDPPAGPSAARDVCLAFGSLVARNLPVTHTSRSRAKQYRVANYSSARDVQFSQSSWRQWK